MSTAAQAKSVVAAARFPPKGIRGFGSPFTQTAWGVSVAAYLAQANDGIVVMTQVETVDAVKNLNGKQLVCNNSPLLCERTYNNVTYM